MRTFQKSVFCILMVAISCSFMSFQLSSNAAVSSKDDLKIQTLAVKISKFGNTNGEATLVAHSPRNMNLNIFSGSHYQVNWYTKRGDLIASNTTEIPYSCGLSVIVVVQKRFSTLSGGDTFQAFPCKSGFEPNGPVYQWPNQ